MRVDSFVKTHVDYLRGVIKIVDTQNVTNDVAIPFADAKDTVLTSTPVKENNSMPPEESSPTCKNNDIPSGAYL